jgi:hypothetical protein
MCTHTKMWATEISLPLLVENNVTAANQCYSQVETLVDLPRILILREHTSYMGLYQILLYCSILLHCVYFSFKYSLPSHMQLTLKVLKFKTLNRFSINVLFL